MGKARNIFIYLSLFIICMLLLQFADAQCSICTRTAQQLGEKPAQGLNAGIMYLAAAPLVIVGVIGYKWWKRNS